MRRLASFAGALLLILVLQYPAFSQSITSGDVAGVITDPSGAVVPRAEVTAKNDSTGAARTTTTNGQGFYRFSLLLPGSYTVSTNITGFQPTTRKVEVSVGQAASADIVLQVSTATTTVEVTTTPVQVENADNTTTFGTAQISNVPNPGNDLSAIAQTAPGATMNTQGGFGNFSTYGLPATSNLFTIDGQNDNDPFLNLNNSGATNLLLGANEIQDATVVNNGYSGQYGQLAGSQVNYVTKSGGNAFHGNAAYFWNGRTMNANSWFNNQTGTPRAFDNVNQWAASFGGPIKKDKTFFFVDYEGLRIVLPTSNAAFIPSQQFATATLANVAATHPASLPFYQTMMNLYRNAPGAAAAVPTAPAAGDSCSAVSAAAPGAFPAGTPCVATFRSTAGNFTHEYLVALRIDQKFSENDTLFGRFQHDHGVQATLTDVINPLFNLQSDQPEYQGQLGWTHLMGANKVNEFKASGQWYSAVFTNANRAATLAAFPTNLQLGDSSLSALGGSIPSASFIATNAVLPIPQGRNVTQYQFVDDFSWTRGNETFKFGVNYHRNNVTDFDVQENTAGLVTINSLTDFFNGGGTGDSLLQNFPTRLSQPLAVYGLAGYVQDEFRLSKKLKVTLALRVDHNSIPVCQTNCFSRLVTPFSSLNHTNSANVPYNQTVLTGFHAAWPETDRVVWQPRIGFAFSPTPDNKTVIRGGFGIFSDSFPASVADTLLFNPPTLAQFTVKNLAPAPFVGGDLFTQAAGANSAFQTGFATGGTANSLGLIGSQPAFTSTDHSVRQPRYQEWNFEVQRELGWRTVLSVNYVGNHGIYEAVTTNGLNGFVPTGATLPDGTTNPFPSGFGGLPTVAPDLRFGNVTQVQTIAVSNYNGLVTSLRHQFNKGFAFQLNYTWSHAIDEVSNGGLLPFNNTTNVSPLLPVNPFNLRQNYGSADYDVRHYFSANYVWDDLFRHFFHGGPNAILGGWTVSGTLFTRSGLPFSVVDGATSAFLRTNNFSTSPPYVVFANVAGPTSTTQSCNSGASVNPCLNIAGFATPTSLTVNQGRNSFRGPDYFNTDLTIMKYTKITEKANLGVGFQFFNLFNHPNFDQPVNDIANPSFGMIQRTVSTPTSLLGSFLGGDASPRLIQLKAEVKF
jgi:hypothetical protein